MDAIVWDSETPPDWSEGDHGWELDDVAWFRSIEAPPAAEPADGGES